MSGKRRSRKKKPGSNFPIWPQALICNKGQLRTHPLLYLQTWILPMAGHKGLINTSFYFGVGQESKSSIALGQLSVYIELCRINMVQPLQIHALLPLSMVLLR